MPALVRILWQGWKNIGHAIGRVLSFILLTIAWVSIIALYAIALKIAKLFRHHPSPATYWVNPPEEVENGLRYQF
ncbi:MAG: hypothetical protein V1926_02805 [Candidatus Peregrinibacteria bacterium]